MKPLSLSVIELKERPSTVILSVAVMIALQSP